jgi:hypothetical protein
MVLLDRALFQPHLQPASDQRHEAAEQPVHHFGFYPTAERRLEQTR